MNIATLANKNALNDLKVFFYTLQLWNETLPTVYVYCDSFIEAYIKNEKPYKGEIHTKNALEKYSNYDRKQMEQMPGNEFPSLFGDFVIEKTHLMDWVFETKDSVLFCDADICFLDKLPIIPDGTVLGVSPHVIRIRDEEKFGIYNAGFLYAAHKTIPAKWKEYSRESKFFEQIAIEKLVESFPHYIFPIQNNYGWWRLLQGRESMETLSKKWSIKRGDGCGIHVEGAPLLSVHTHWDTNDSATKYFNTFILAYFSLLKSVKKTKELHAFLLKN